MYSRKRRQYSLGRPRQRPPVPSRPLPRTLGARPAAEAFVSSDSSAADRQGNSTTGRPASPSRHRGLRGLAVFIMALLPLSIMFWGLSIVVPVMIEAREAMDDVFVTPVDRAHFDDAEPSPPQLPTS